MSCDLRWTHRGVNYTSAAECARSTPVLRVLLVWWRQGEIKYRLTSARVTSVVSFDTQFAHDPEYGHWLVTNSTSHLHGGVCVYAKLTVYLPPFLETIHLNCNARTRAITRMRTDGRVSHAWMHMEFKKAKRKFSPITTFSWSFIQISHLSSTSTGVATKIPNKQIKTRTAGSRWSYPLMTVIFIFIDSASAAGLSYLRGVCLTQFSDVCVGKKKDQRLFQWLHSVDKTGLGRNPISSSCC